ncbi:ACT domain-containing protein [Clostridium estertheticum]|uniref:ACT domain-containing protein n=1 Tax=Clostridium estertheticum TaxID=238834 RepID=UPI0039A52A4E
MLEKILALKKISIFAVSTYDTDYILVKNKDINNAILALSNERYEVINQENMV